jgi:hypothetical protein
VSVGILYGVGAGDSAGDGEGASVAPRVLGGFLFADLFVADGVGDALVVAAVVVAVVPCCCVHETINATPIKAAINENIYFFISSDRAPENVWLLGTEGTGCIKTAADREDVLTCSWSDNKGHRLYVHMGPRAIPKLFSFDKADVSAAFDARHFILDRSSVAALRRISSSRSCSEI